MAQFICGSCGHSGHFSEFKTGSHFEDANDDEGIYEETVEVDDVECPDCGSESCFED